MPRAGHGLGLLASCQALSSLAWTLNFRLEPKPGSRECKIYSVIHWTDCIWNVREAWSHREDTPPTSLGRRPSYTARRKEAVKSHQRLRVLHISLDPETWEPLSTESNYSSISVPLSQLSWALASDIGSYPHRPTIPRPPTFFYTSQDMAFIERLICFANADLGWPWTNGWREKVKVSMSPFLLLFPLTHMGFIFLQV